MDNANHLANQNPIVPSSKNPNKPYYIVLSLLSFLIVVLGVADIYIYTTKNNSTNNNADTSNTDNTNNATSTTAFEDLTKEEALAFLRAQTDTTGTLPENYVGEEISSAVITNGHTIVSDLDLIYSYGTIEELKEMAHKEYSGFNFLATDNTEEYDDSNFEITEYDYYAIVTPKRAKGATSCDHGYNNAPDGRPGSPG